MSTLPFSAPRRCRRYCLSQRAGGLLGRGREPLEPLLDFELRLEERLALAPLELERLGAERVELREAGALEDRTLELRELDALALLVLRFAEEELRTLLREDEALGDRTLELRELDARGERLLVDAPRTLRGGVDFCGRALELRELVARGDRPLDVEGDALLVRGRLVPDTDVERPLELRGGGVAFGGRLLLGAAVARGGRAVLLGEAVGRSLLVTGGRTLGEEGGALGRAEGVGRRGWLGEAVTLPRSVPLGFDGRAELGARTRSVERQLVVADRVDLPLADPRSFPRRTPSTMT